MKDFLFSSESVTEGHPDKMCDQISDSILDAIIAQDPLARVACETACNTGLVLIMGEITTNCYVDIPSITRKTILEIGYDRAKYGFDGSTCAVLTSIDEQSRDIAQGVDHSMEDKAGEGFENGAGDQGMMFGFACNETEQYMPLPIELAHKLTRKLAQVRKSGKLPWIRPDGKSQVSVRYENGKPISVDTVVVSTQHAEDIEIGKLREAIIEEVVKPTIPKHLIKNTQFLINPTGRFVIGGPMGDSGLTGRKIIVDTYGGYARHGGGAFSGKDPTKVDRSAAYAARWVAKHVVAANLADKCELELAYAIGVAHPVSIFIETFGTAKIDEEKLLKAITRVFDLRPTAIIEALNLRNPIYKQIASYGHFGRDDLDLPWERLNRLEEFIQAAKG